MKSPTINVFPLISLFRYILFEIVFFQEVELLDHMVVLFIFFLGGVIFGHPTAYGALGPGIRLEPQSQPKSQLWQHKISNPLC